ncbi:MAG: hypothetical protein P1U42_03135 [Phycisphaerales bacterium]|nr:hypothetical protein [Phycisphaerales bacterium]
MNRSKYKSRQSLSVLRIVAAAGALCVASAFAISDEIVMRDGTVYTGTIVSKTRRTVEIDTQVHGISTRLKLDRRSVKSIVTGDLQTAPTTDVPQTILPKVTEPVEDPNKVIKREGYNLLLEVPLKGTFGKEIYPLGVANALAWAAENEVTDVVFRIDSGGGAVWAAMDMVDIMEQYKGKIKMHMLIESSISASIWPSFTCDTITMAPGSDFGGAVAYTQNSSGSAEVDLKLNGIWAAKLESAADANGFESYLVRAMMLSKSSIYAYQEDGEWKFSDTTEGLPKNYETIDGPDSVLTLTAKQAIKYGLVDAMPDGKSLQDFAEAQGIDKWDSAGDIGHEIIERDTEKAKKLLARLESTYRSFLVESNNATGRNYVSTLGSSLQTMRKQLGLYKRLLNDAEELHMPSMVEGFAERLDIDFWENEIETRMAELRRTRRRGP